MTISTKHLSLATLTTTNVLLDIIRSWLSSRLSVLIITQHRPAFKLQRPIGLECCTAKKICQKFWKQNFENLFHGFCVLANRLCVPCFATIRENCGRSNDLKKIWQHTDRQRSITDTINSAICKLAAELKIVSYANQAAVKTTNDNDTVVQNATVQQNQHNQHTWLKRRVNATTFGALMSFSLVVHAQLVSSCKKQLWLKCSDRCWKSISYTVCSLTKHWQQKSYKWMTIKNDKIVKF